MAGQGTRWTAKNKRGPEISTSQSVVSAWVIPTNEELLIAATYKFSPRVGESRSNKARGRSRRVTFSCTLCLPSYITRMVLDLRLLNSRAIVRGLFDV